MPFPTTGPVSYAFASSLLAESCRIAATLGAGGIHMDPLTTSVFGALIRGIRLAGGASVLIEKRMQGEAFILGRSLFDDSLWMAEVGYDKQNRNALLLGWRQKSLREF